MANINPTWEELQDISKACNRLWELDSNRLEPEVDYKIDLQEGKTSWEHGDAASEKLFISVDPSVFQRPTYKLFLAILDNYERGTGQSENVTSQELAENNQFLNACLESAPMRYAFNWLVKKNKVPDDLNTFKRRLDSIWFGLYRRETQNDSSGFEHVFVGEEKDGKITGCHNWIQMYNEERRGKLDYLGYIKPKQRGCAVTKPHNHEQLVTIQFAWEHEIKPVSTSLIGVSPEFEMAIYSLCFLNGNENNHVQLGPYRCNVKCFSFGSGDRAKIGSVFLEALPLDENHAASKIQAQYRGRQVRQQNDYHIRNANRNQHHQQEKLHGYRPQHTDRAGGRALSLPSQGGNTWKKKDRK